MNIGRRVRLHLAGAHSGPPNPIDLSGGNVGLHPNLRRSPTVGQNVKEEQVTQLLNFTQVWDCPHISVSHCTILSLLCPLLLVVLLHNHDNLQLHAKLQNPDHAVVWLRKSVCAVVNLQFETVCWRSSIVDEIRLLASEKHTKKHPHGLLEQMHIIHCRSCGAESSHPMHSCLVR